MIQAEQARKLTNASQGLQDVEATPLSQHVYTATRQGHDHIMRRWNEDEFNEAKEAGYHAHRSGGKMIVSW